MNEVRNNRNLMMILNILQGRGSMQTAPLFFSVQETTCGASQDAGKPSICS